MKERKTSKHFSDTICKIETQDLLIVFLPVIVWHSNSVLTTALVLSYD